MTECGSFAQEDGFFIGERGRSNEKDFALTGQQLPLGNVVKQLSATSFGQNFPPCTSQITEKLQFPNNDICAPDLEDVKRAAKRFIETTISSTNNYYSLQKQPMNCDIYNGDVEDAEFAHVLDNLPTSYDDFESKELHLKLERNLSSPLMTCQSPNADSGRVSAGSSLTKSSNMYLCDAGSNPLDADDLEVAMINQSFEEQQKQTKLYASPGLKNLFYSQPNTTDDRVIVKSFDKEVIRDAKHSLLIALDNRKNDRNEEQLFPADLLLTGVSTNSIISKESLTVDSAWTVCQEKFAKTELEPLAVVKSSDIQKIASDSPKASAEFGSASQETFGSSVVAMKAMSALMGSQHMKGSQDTSSASITDDNMDATEALAVNVVRSLLDRSGLTETSYGTKDNQDLAKSNNKNNISTPSKNKLTCLTELMKSKKKQEFVDEGKSRDEAVIPSSGAVDSWEELDNDDYSSKLIEMAMCKVKIRKPKINYFSGPLVDPWDDNLLPHVLEAFNLPIRFTEDDVKQELAKHDCADVTIRPVDDTHCLVVFASKSAALQAMIAVRQRQSIAKVRLRSLCDATRASQEKARKYEAILLPHKQRPQTTPLVARRLVEGALGKRSNVSAQQVSNERKQLKDAKDLKQAKAALWEDDP